MTMRPSLKYALAILMGQLLSMPTMADDELPGGTMGRFKINPPKLPDGVKVANYKVRADGKIIDFERSYRVRANRTICVEVLYPRGPGYQVRDAQPGDLNKRYTRYVRSTSWNEKDCSLKIEAGKTVEYDLSAIVLKRGDVPLASMGDPLIAELRKTGVSYPRIGVMGYRYPEEFGESGLAVVVPQGEWNYAIRIKSTVGSSQPRFFKKYERVFTLNSGDPKVIKTNMEDRRLRVDMTSTDLMFLKYNSETIAFDGALRQTVWALPGARAFLHNEQREYLQDFPDLRDFFAYDGCETLSYSDFFELGDIYGDIEFYQPGCD
ncbi:MAG: hypothetical protein HRU19_23125 [Pseudobacteriovorax sp.]|nr:hypothetical protein [Pseudobacteriovorax sp.]